MGGEFPPHTQPETNTFKHLAAVRFFADEWPDEVVLQGFELGHPVMTGEALKRTPARNPVRSAYELRFFEKRPAIGGGQPSY